MAEILHKICEAEVKKLNDLTFEFTASTESLDRDGEVIQADGWDLKNFKKNPVVTYAHNYSGLPVGRVPKIWVDKQEHKLKNHVEFPPVGTYEFADICRRMVEAGFLRTESVGFIPLEWEDAEGDGKKSPRRIHKRQELLEIALVAVPSQPDALMAAKSAGVLDDKQIKAFEAVTKPEETENYIHIPVKGEEGKHDGHRIRTIDISAKEGIKALYCGECKKVITYLFAKDDWTMERAQAWVKEHAKTVWHILMKDGEALSAHENEMALIDAIPADAKEPTPKPKEISQGSIKDELDYIDTAISKVGLSKETAFDAVDVAIRILARAWPYHQWESITLGANLTGAKEPVIFQRISGSDIPVEDKKPSLSMDEIKQVVKDEFAKALKKAQGKLN